MKGAELLGLLGLTAIAGATGGAAAAVVAVAVVGYVNGKAFALQVEPIDDDGHALRSDAAAAFRNMRAAAASAGVELVVNSAFRTWVNQDYFYKLYLAGTGNLAAKPGYSNHQSGIAVDIHNPPEVLAWLDENASLFGFRRTVPSENWHWEFTA